MVSVLASGDVGGPTPNIGAAPAGSNRGLFAFPRRADSGSDDYTSCTYGDQSMTLLHALNLNGHQDACFYLDEAGIAAASGTTLTPNLGSLSARTGWLIVWVEDWDSQAVSSSAADAVEFANPITTADLPNGSATGLGIAYRATDANTSTWTWTGATELADRNSGRSSSCVATFTDPGAGARDVECTHGGTATDKEAQIVLYLDEVAPTQVSYVASNVSEGTGSQSVSTPAGTAGDIVLLLASTYDANVTPHLVGDAATQADFTLIAQGEETGGGRQISFHLLDTNSVTADASYDVQLADDGGGNWTEAVLLRITDGQLQSTNGGVYTDEDHDVPAFTVDSDGSLVVLFMAGYGSAPNNTTVTGEGYTSRESIDGGWSRAYTRELDAGTYTTFSAGSDGSAFTMLAIFEPADDGPTVYDLGPAAEAEAAGSLSGSKAGDVGPATSDEAPGSLALTSAQLTITLVSSDSDDQGPFAGDLELTLGSFETNDIAVLFARADNDLAVLTISPSTGWTQILDEGPTSGRDRTEAVWWKRLTAGDSDPTVQTDDNQERSATVHVFRGVDTTTAIDAAIVFNSGENDNTPTAPAITTLTDGAAVVTGHGASHNEITTTAAPSGYTLGASVIGDMRGQSVAYLLDAGAAGTKSPGDWLHANTGSTAEWSVWTVALRPASGEGGLSLPIGPVAEGEAPGSVGLAKAGEVGPAVGADAAGALVGSKALELGAATSAEAPGSLALTLTESIGPAVSAEAAGSLSLTKALELEVVPSAEAPGSLAGSRLLQLGPVGSTEAAGAASVVKALAVGPVASGEAAGAFDLAGSLAIGPAVSGEAAGSLEVVRSLTVGPAVGSGAPGALAGSKVLGLGPVVSGEAPGVLSLEGSELIGPAVSAEAPGVLALVKSLPLSPVSGGGAPGSLAAGRVLVIGPAGGSGAAGGLSASKALVLAGAASAEAAGSLSVGSVELIGPVAGGEAAGGLLLVKSAEFGPVVSVEAAGSLSVAGATVVGVWVRVVGFGRRHSVGSLVRRHGAVLEGRR